MNKSRNFRFKKLNPEIVRLLKILLFSLLEFRNINTASSLSQEPQRGKILMMTFLMRICATGKRIIFTREIIMSMQP